MAGRRARCGPTSQRGRRPSRACGPARGHPARRPALRLRRPALVPAVSHGAVAQRRQRPARPLCLAAGRDRCAAGVAHPARTLPRPLAPGCAEPGPARQRHRVVAPDRRGARAGARPAADRGLFRARGAHHDRGQRRRRADQGAAGARTRAAGGHRSRRFRIRGRHRARGRGRAGAGRQCAQGGAGGLAAEGRPAVSQCALVGRQEHRAGAAARTRLCLGQLGRHRRRGRSADEHGAAVRGRRQRPAVPPRHAADRGPVDARCLAGAQSVDAADRRAGDRVADARLPGAAAEGRSVREHRRHAGQRPRPGGGGHRAGAGA